MGRIDSYEAIDSFTGNERIVVETDEGTRKASFSQIQDKIADCVEDKAEMLSFSDVSVTKNTESEYVLDITIGSKHITTPNLKGERYILTESDKADVAALVASQSSTLKTVFAFTDDELNAILMNLMEDFSSNVPLNIIYVTDDGTSQLIILDSGSGNPDDCIIIENGFNDVPFTQDTYDAIKLNSKKNSFTNYTAYKGKTYSTGSVNTISFSGTGTQGIRSARALITLPPLKNVKFGIGVNQMSGTLVADMLLATELDYTINNLIIEIDTYSEGYYMTTITLTDGTGVIYSNKKLESATADGISSFRFRIDSASSASYTVDYVGIGG